MNLNLWLAIMLLFFPVFVCAQTQSKSDANTIISYSFDKCSVGITPLKGSTFDLTGTMRGYYRVPLSEDQIPPESFKDEILVGLSCFTDANTKAIMRATGGYVYHNNRWTRSEKYVAIQSEEKAPLIQFTFNNWDAIIRINPPAPPDPNLPPAGTQIFDVMSYCIKETSGNQLICGVCSNSDEGYVVLHRLIDALKTITFIEMSASKKL